MIHAEIIAEPKVNRIWLLCAALLFADLTALAARIAIPVPPVPLTMQTAAVFLSGSILGPSYGALSQLLYLVMGLSGLPFFNLGGGLAYLFKPTFGYLAGFVGGAWLVGFLTKRAANPKFLGRFTAMIAGMAVIYAFGVAYLYGNLRYIQKLPVTMAFVLKTGLLLPLPGDIIKAVLAAWISGLVPNIMPSRPTARFSPEKKS